MHVRDIKKEAEARFEYARWITMLPYLVTYVLALNIALFSVVLFVLSKWAVIYGAVLFVGFLILLAPFCFGMSGYYLKLYRYDVCDPAIVAEGFRRKNISRVIKLHLLRFVICLGFTILLIVPGIIYAVQTSMATYLLRANPNLTPKAALSASRRVMKNHNKKYFLLMLSFLGWFLAGIVTAGIAFIWVLPYYNAAKVIFYKRELQGDKAEYKPGAAPANKPAAGAQANVAAVKPKPAQPADSNTAAADAKVVSYPPTGEPWNEQQAIPYELADGEVESKPQLRTDELYAIKEPKVLANENWNSVESIPYEVTDEEEEHAVIEPAVIEAVAEPITIDGETEIIETVEEKKAAEKVIAESPNTETRIEPVARPSSIRNETREQAPQDIPLRHAEIRPLPGSRVTVNESGARSTEPRGDRIAPARESAVRPSERANSAAVAPESSQVRESVHERLERIRAERAAHANTKDNGEDKR